MRAAAALMFALIGLVFDAEVGMAEKIRKPESGDTIVIPESSMPKPGQGHTNVEIFVPSNPFVQPKLPAQSKNSPSKKTGK